MDDPLEQEMDARGGQARDSATDIESISQYRSCNLEQCGPTSWTRDPGPLWERYPCCPEAAVCESDSSPRLAAASSPIQK
jgi:hypothetical protein